MPIKGTKFDAQLIANEIAISIKETNTAVLHFPCKLVRACFLISDADKHKKILLLLISICIDIQIYYRQKSTRNQDVFYG